MSKAQRKRTSGTRRYEVQHAKARVSNETLEQVNLIESSMRRYAEEDSSSEEEVEEGRRQDLVSRTLANYMQLLDSDEKGEAVSLLQLPGSWSCLICLSTVRRVEAVWSCEQCACLFHLMCIQQWARDCLHLVNQSSLSPDIFPEVLAARNWSCPKCRQDYSQSQIPKAYYCFCKKKLNPEPDAWLLPHSCGETCNKLLSSGCGHRCASLCHPGTCPSCPRTVQLSCHCGRSKPLTKRCGHLGWSCGRLCGRVLSCQLHTCELRCHEGDCLECEEVISQPCRCGKQVIGRPCGDPEWSCEQVCGELLSCGQHHCQLICHSGGCGQCPRDGERTCPCGKTKHTLSCTEEVPTCGDTCGKGRNRMTVKLLHCGQHHCTRLCHLGGCGQCLQMAHKTCRCGKKTKLVPCSQEFLCESRCNKMRQCGRHGCKRKCCNGECPPCEQICNKQLGCRNHKCLAPCHTGPCYPCVLNAEVSCFCGAAKVTVLCGKEKSVRAPRCSRACALPSACHHPQRHIHNCHFGPCPPCALPCQRPLPCGHLCQSKCHSEPRLPERPPGAAPWVKLDPVKKVVVPCPPCMQLVSRRCRGGHEVSQFHCSESCDYSCGRSCGRLLACGNHLCERGCHVVINPPSEELAGEDCLPCERECEKDRQEGCTHACPLPCHSGACPKCEVLVKLTCHCLTMNLYVKCFEWCAADHDKKNDLQTCNSQCTKQLNCGHRCPNTCHPGPCPDQTTCKKRISIRCSCKRIKKDFRCCERGTVVCDDVCFEIIAQKKKERERLERERKEIEERERRLAEEALERQLRPRRRRQRSKQNVEEEVEPSWRQKTITKLGYVLLLIVVVAIVYSAARLVTSLAS